MYQQKLPKLKCKEKKMGKNRIPWSCETITKGIAYQNLSTRRREKKSRNAWRNNSQEFSKINDKYKNSVLEISENTKQDKHKTSASRHAILRMQKTKDKEKNLEKLSGVGWEWKGTLPQSSKENNESRLTSSRKMK